MKELSPFDWGWAEVFVAEVFQEGRLGLLSASKCSSSGGGLGVSKGEDPTGLAYKAAGYGERQREP